MVAARMFYLLWKNLSNLTKCAGGSSEKRRGRYEQLDNDFDLELDSNGNSINDCSSSGTLSKSSSCDSNGNPKKGFLWKFTFDSSSSNKNTEDDISTNEDLNSYPLSAHFDEEEGYTCDVCERSFFSLKKLNDHQFKKRHYGCLQCDSIFPSREALESHRDQMDHFDYSDYDSDTTSCDLEMDEFDLDGNDLFGDIEEEDEKELLL